MIRYLSFTVAVGCLLLTHSTAWAETISEIVKRVKPAVVEIVALNRKASPMKFGTGFFISSDGQQQGREGLKQVIAALRTAFPDIHWVTEEMVGEGDKVFSRFTWHGTHRGEFFGVPATGRQITVKGMVVDRVVAGKMVDSRILMDGLGMMTQLGVIPAEKAVTSQKAKERWSEGA